MLHPGHQSDIESWLRRAESGDPVAIDELLGSMREYLRSVVRLRMGPALQSRVDASDIVQEAQLEAFRRLQEYLANQAIPFHLWFRRIAIDHLIRARRQHLGAECRTLDREVSLDGSSDAAAEKLVHSSVTPSAKVEIREARGLVESALARLPEDDRELLLMRHFEGLSNKDISCVLSVDPSLTSRRYGRALIRLRNELRDLGLGDSHP
jgi:RNA polymerase sigma-70 factor (ECF subfamily)